MNLIFQLVYNSSWQCWNKELCILLHSSKSGEDGFIPFHAEVWTRQVQGLCQGGWRFVEDQLDLLCRAIPSTLLGSQSPPQLHRCSLCTVSRVSSPEHDWSSTYFTDWEKVHLKCKSAVVWIFRSRNKKFLWLASFLRALPPHLVRAHARRRRCDPGDLRRLLVHAESRRSKWPGGERAGQRGRARLDFAAEGNSKMFHLFFSWKLFVFHVLFFPPAPHIFPLCRQCQATWRSWRWSYPRPRSTPLCMKALALLLRVDTWNSSCKASKLFLDIDQGQGVTKVRLSTGIHMIPPLHYGWVWLCPEAQIIQKRSFF